MNFSSLDSAYVGLSFDTNIVTTLCNIKAETLTQRQRRENVSVQSIGFTGNAFSRHTIFCALSFEATCAFEKIWLYLVIGLTKDSPNCSDHISCTLWSHIWALNQQ